MVKILCVGGKNTMSRGSKYDGLGVQYTMDRGFNIPYVGVKIPLVGEGGSIYNTMDRGSIYHG